MLQRPATAGAAHRAESRRSMIRAMYSPSKLRLTITTMRRFLHTHEAGNTARCQKE